MQSLEGRVSDFSFVRQYEGNVLYLRGLKGALPLRDGGSKGFAGLPETIMLEQSFGQVG
jgi:hypothetical protein